MAERKKWEEKEDIQYKAAVLDPRPIPVARENNNKIFAGNKVYGIEVTVPALAELCTENLDPQHTDNDSNTAAIEAAITTDLPPEDAILATVRADLDSVGAMAVLNMRARGEDIDATKERIQMVADADTFAKDEYPGQQQLPTREQPWSQRAKTAESSGILAAIAAEIADFKVPMADRVTAMEEWLRTGKESETYREQVEKERENMIEALEKGEIQHELHADGKIAFVKSTHRSATQIGYALSPVVVALNPEFTTGPGEPYRKFTVCAYNETFADIKEALDELNEIEEGWGGSPTIGGSPQGKSSELGKEQVIEIVEKHLK